jgi:hypothetical protein
LSLSSLDIVFDRTFLALSCFSLMAKPLILILMLTLSCQLAGAQSTDTTAYHVVLSSGGSINRTDRGSSYLLNNSLNVGMKGRGLVLNSGTAWLYGRQDGTLTNNDFSSSLNLNLDGAVPHAYYWGLLNYNTSVSLGLGHQLLAGAGIAYSLLDRERAYLNLSNGILYDRSNLVAGANYHTYRNSLRLQYKFVVLKFVTLEGSNFMQHSISRKGDYIIRTNNSIGIRLREWISFNTSLSFNRLNVTGSDNLNLTYGLTFDRIF